MIFAVPAVPNVIKLGLAVNLATFVSLIFKSKSPYWGLGSSVANDMTMLWGSAPQSTLIESTGVESILALIWVLYLITVTGTSMVFGE